MAQEVVTYIGIPVFRHDHRDGGMGSEEVAEPATYAALLDRARDLAGDIDHFQALLGANRDIRHHPNILRRAKACRQPRPQYRSLPSRPRSHHIADSLRFGCTWPGLTWRKHSTART